MLQSILKSITPREFYEKLLGRVLPQINMKGDVSIKCPFHVDRIGKEDKHDSLSVSLIPERGGVFNCFGCGAQGNLITFFKELRKCTSLRQTAEELIAEFELNPEVFKSSIVDEAQVLEWAHELHNSTAGKALLEHLSTKRHLSNQVISEFRLGINPAGRLTIPILDVDGSIVNIKQWLPEYKRITELDHKLKCIGLPGCGIYLFPCSVFPTSNTIILCEGELDCLALHSIGFPAVSSTGGADGFKIQWIKFFEDKEVIIILDNDAAGRKSANTILEKLYNVTRRVKVVHLEEQVSDFDVTNFITKFGKQSRDQLNSLINSAVWFHKLSETNSNYLKVNLFSAVTADKINKRIELDGRLIGKEFETFAVPKRIKCTCYSDNQKPDKKCIGCPRLKNGTNEYEVDLELDSANILELLRLTTSAARLRFFQDLFNITCKTATFEITEYANIEEIRVIPDYSLDADAYEHTIRFCYFIGYGLRINSLYTFRGRTVVDPVNNQVTHIFTDAIISDTITNLLDMKEEREIGIETKTVMEHLKTFQPREDQSTLEKLYDIYTDFEANVTKIWKRQDLIEAFDITYHSPISFMFGDDVVQQGWVSSLILGDTQCGKTETLVRLRKHFNIGLILSGEALSRVGIMGGFIEVAGHRGAKFMLGAFPLNDGKLVAIDEFSGLSTEQIGELTLLRSYGKSIVTKQAQHYEYPARVRTIMLSNPRDGRKISSFNLGCLAITKLVGSEADTARFDIFVIVAGDEVKLDEINTYMPLYVEHKYTSELCSLLLNWVWTRKTTDYKFDIEAQKLVFTYATKMAEQYDSSVPIVVAGSHRWTIARIAASIAARLFSTDEFGKSVIVKTAHVEAAVTFLYKCYNKPSMGYDIYSARRKKEETIMNEKALVTILKRRAYIVTEQLTLLSRFSRSEFENVTGIDTWEIKEILSDLVKLGAIKSVSGYFYPTTGLKIFLKTFVHPNRDDPFGEKQ
ncbi:MAG: toprim domain-containing protein [Candidatus Paceibacterota bacterium]|jgi:5S rRNA maturation endonuclease (ribonuclease M5)